MTKAQHTPGPWKAVGENQDIIVPADAQPPYTDRIAGIYIYYSERKGEGEANARLIAAAPELLESLESIICITDLREHNKNRPGGLFELLRDAAGTARSAIAKATGKAA